MRKLLVFLVVFGLLAVVADRVARKFATDEAQRRLVASGVASPQVDVGGFPFLTQLLARRFGDVEVTAPSVRIGSGRADKVSAIAHDVEVPSSGPATAGRLTAHGTITYAEVVRQANQGDLRLTSAGAGLVQMRRDVSVLGHTYAVVARARIAAKGTRVRVTPTSVRLSAGGSVGLRLSGLIADRLTFTYRVRGLPEGVQINRITPAQNGLVVAVSGRDVRLAT